MSFASFDVCSISLLQSFYFPFVVLSIPLNCNSVWAKHIILCLRASYCAAQTSLISSEYFFKLLLLLYMNCTSFRSQKIRISHRYLCWRKSGKYKSVGSWVELLESKNISKYSSEFFTENVSVLAKIIQHLFS